MATEVAPAATASATALPDVAATSSAASSSSSSSAASVAPAPREQFEFQAEIHQLLSLIVNTLYSTKEIAVRELISNSSDALDKIRYLSYKDEKVLEGAGRDFHIEVIPNVDDGTLTIVDTGVGMTKKELINNLGCIARSGTRQFMEMMQAGADLSLIGQFGVGFYSSYLIANKVVVVSKAANDDQYIWESEAGGTFTVRKDNGEYPPMKRGTMVVLQLKDDQKEYLKRQRLEDVIKKHSEFIAYPIKLRVEKTVDETVPDPEAEEKARKEREEKKKKKEDAAKKDGEDGKVEEVDDDEDKPSEKKTKTISKKVQDWEVLNKQEPIWMKNASDVKPEEYQAFYKALSNDYQNHLAVKHIHGEGDMEFRALLFVPRRAPFDMFESRKKMNNIKLYVRRVFIMDNCEDLIPEWLSFIRGIVDSEDLPLNISREMLQQQKVLHFIRKALVKNCIAMFSDLAENKEDYKTFYENFSKNLKLGIHEDTNNRSKLCTLLRFHSSKSGADWTSLDEYCSRMKPGQKSIYFLTGESKLSVETSPFLERLRKKDYECLYMYDPIDEYMVQSVKDYTPSGSGTSYKLVNISKDNTELEEDDEEKKALDLAKKELSDLCAYIKEVLSDKVEKVVVTNRLVDSPCILSTAEYSWTANMERIQRSQALKNSSFSMYMMSKKTMEINPKNAVVQHMRKTLAADRNDKSLKELIHLLFDTAMLTSGFTLDDPSSYGGRIFRMVHLALDLKGDEPAPAVASSGATSSGASSSPAPAATTAAAAAAKSSLDDVDD
jgi:molecular chaperone HtpG